MKTSRLEEGVCHLVNWNPKMRREREKTADESEEIMAKIFTKLIKGMTLKIQRGKTSSWLLSMGQV